ncbi:MAG TPA: 2-C-methyl-D-erythritol 2,4-cyclodiphosphate synthase [Clostridiales bacterium]|nr:2-C-methyl-D-erythritol 2,4-cyclodiphosphate synthase [Clostridiales bacterium]
MKVGIGQDSHRFDFDDKEKKLILGGIIFEGYPPLKGNSDADVVLHSLTNAISGVTCVNILGEISDKMCFEENITDSSAYLKEALKYMGDNKIVHVSISVECQRPKISPKIPEMRRRLSELLRISESCIGITATTGEDLTEFGKGNGIQVFSSVVVVPGIVRIKPDYI